MSVKIFAKNKGVSHFIRVLQHTLKNEDMYVTSRRWSIIKCKTFFALPNSQFFEMATSFSKRFHHFTTGNGSEDRDTAASILCKVQM